jgi:hypothetical protein
VPAVWSGADSYQEVGEEEAHSGMFMVYGGGESVCCRKIALSTSHFGDLFTRLDHQWDLGY